MRIRIRSDPLLSFSDRSFVVHMRILAPFSDLSETLNQSFPKLRYQCLKTNSYRYWYHELGSLEKGQERLDQNLIMLINFDRIRNTGECYIFIPA